MFFSTLSTRNSKRTFVARTGISVSIGEMSLPNDNRIVADVINNPVMTVRVMIRMGLVGVFIGSFIIVFVGLLIGMLCHLLRLAQFLLVG